jgi:hypothetical protein
MDDFMILAQAPKHIYTRDNFLCHLDSIFRDKNESLRRTIVSDSKVLKGDTTFATTKRILGWDLDTASMEIRLPQHQVERLQDLISTFLQNKHSTRTKW